MHLGYSYMVVTGIIHDIFACSDLFGVDTDDTETAAWFLIILPTVSKSKKIFMLYLLHSLALFYCPYQSG